MDIYENSYKLDQHFSFGKNWQNFLESLNDDRINEAKKSLVEFLDGEEKIKGKTFVDIGCGSGLFSLAAYLLGASRVVSVDVDEFSVACAKYLKEKYKNPDKWEIKTGSALNGEFIKLLGEFDIVYSWGVLHHTGNMYESFENIAGIIKPGGKFYLAIYNKFNRRFKGGTSNTWLKIKKIYNESSDITKGILNFLYASYILIVRVFFLQSPLKYTKDYQKKRGMSFYTDIKDWLGGYPYEYATTDEIVNFFGKKNIFCQKMKSVDGTGCNEFLLIKTDGNF